MDRPGRLDATGRGSALAQTVSRSCSVALNRWARFVVAGSASVSSTCSCRQEYREVAPIAAKLPHLSPPVEGADDEEQDGRRHGHQGDPAHLPAGQPDQEDRHENDVRGLHLPIGVQSFEQVGAGLGGQWEPHRIGSSGPEPTAGLARGAR